MLRFFLHYLTQIQIGQNFNKIWKNPSQKPLNAGIFIPAYEGEDTGFQNITGFYKMVVKGFATNFPRVGQDFRITPWHCVLLHTIQKYPFFGY